MMRRLMSAAICGAWLAILAALVSPLPLAVFAGGVSGAGLTPLFYGLWAAAAIWMYALESTVSMGRTSLIAGGTLTLLIAAFALWPPIDRITLTVAVGAIPLAAAQWYLASIVHVAGSTGRSRLKGCRYS